METKHYIVNKPMAVVLRVSRLFCVGPLLFVPLRNSFRISTSRGYALMGHVIIGLYITFDICSNIYVELIKREGQRIHVRSFLSLIYLSVHILTIATMLTVISITGISRMHHMFNYLDVLKKLNENLGNDSYIDIKMKHLITLMSTYLFVIFFVCAADFYSMVDEITLDIHGSFILFNYISVYFENFVMVMIQIQIAYVIYNIYATLHEMNGRLRSLNKQNKISRSARAYMSVNTFHDANMTRRFRDIYMSISELVREINKNEGIILFLILLFNIQDIIDEVYVIISEKRIIEDSILGIPVSLNCILCIIWCFYGTACNVMLTEPCYWVHQEFQNTRNQVSHLLLNWGPEQLTVEFEDFIDQVIHNVPAFSVIGICDFSRRLVLVILGGLCTIMMMIKQFNFKNTVPS